MNTLDVGLNISNVHGQGYDGASSMSFVHVGIQISFKQHLLPIKDGEQMLSYSLKLVECGKTALHASEIRKEMSYA